jgi:hypothetical protein
MNRKDSRIRELREQKYIILYRQGSKQSKLYQAAKKIKVNKNKKAFAFAAADRSHNYSE